MVPTSCGSGGCSVTYTVRPPVGQSPEALAEQLDVTAEREIPGTFFDPRAVWVSGAAAGSLFTLHMGYVTG